MKHRRIARTLGLVVAACSGAQKMPHDAGNASLLASVEQSPGYRSPASFRYHPARQAVIQAEFRLSDGQLLLAGKRGERWLLDPHTHALSAGANLAPEDLIGILAADNGYWFVGESGTTYEARDALGQFLRVSAPLEPLIRVSAARHSILGIPTDRGLLRSTDGAASFVKVGPPQIEFADVELGSDGTGLALSIPEALWLTRDEGATWTALGGPTRGAFALGRDRKARLRIDSVFGPYHFADRPARIEPGIDPDSAQDLPSSAPPRGPDAAALAEGRAIVLGARYWEVAASPAHPSDYELLVGPLDGELEGKPIPELKECRGARLAGFGPVLELACFRGTNEAGSVLVSFLRSTNSGQRFEREPFTSFGTPASFRFAVGEGGALLATGLCGSPSPGCSTGGVFHRRERVTEQPLGNTAHAEGKGSRWELFASATPTLSESALGLIFSVDGRISYALGRRSKTGALAMFVSQDSGKSFDVRDLDLVRADSDDEDQYWDHSQSSVRLESFAAAEDGSLSAVIADRQGRALVVTDEQGRMLSATKAPEEDALVAGVGARAFALTPKSRRAWESLDGGVSWQGLPRFPVALCTTQTECDVTLRCAPLGCVIGSEVSRIGWSGQSNDDADWDPPAGREPSPPTERKLRSPLACSLDETSWQTLPGVSNVPTSFDAALGKSSFVALAIDPTRASASMVHGFGGSRPHVEVSALLAPVSRPGEYALTALEQVEGSAALRYRLPDDPARDSHLRNVEVAWDNALSGQLVRTRLIDGGPVAPGDYELGDAAQRAVPDLLSIGEGGLYLRLHHAAADAQDTFYLDGRNSTRIPPVNWPILPNLRGRTEMAKHENSHLPLMLFGRGTAVARARRGAGGWEFDAETTGLADPSAFGQSVSSNVAYLGNASGLVLQTESNEGGPASAAFFAFRASGSVMETPIAVPTQADLSDRPAHCSSSDLATTPRVVAKSLPGTRHPILVTDRSDPSRLFLSSEAVLQGTPQTACGRAFDAEEVALGDTPLRHERALLLLDDLEHAFLFRAISDPGGRANGVQFRTMKCRFEPGLEVPSDVYRAPGTLVPRGR